MSDDKWISQFENATLPNHSFHHADHVRMAFLYLMKYPPIEALERFSSDLRRFAQTHGKADRYNETVTWAFLLLIRERLARTSHPQTWAEFAASNQDLLQWQDNVLKKYYRAETLGSALAKDVFIFPDKL